MADAALLQRSVENIGTIMLQQRTVNLLEPYTGDIGAAIDEFLAKNREYREFAGTPELVTDVQQVAIEAPRTGFWKDSNTLDWRESPTGIGTYDEIYPETASAAIQLSTPPPHWALLFGTLESGAGNNVQNVQLKQVNGKLRGIVAVTYSERFAGIKVRRFTKGVILKERGDIDINAEAETTAPIEIIPLAVHILPGEIAKATNVSSYVTTIAA